MKRIGIVVIRMTGVAALAAGFVHAAGAQAPGAAQNIAPLARFEVTPFLGYKFGGKFELEDADGQATREAEVQAHGFYAVAFDVRGSEELQFEFFYSSQSTEVHGMLPASGGVGLDVEYLHVGAAEVLTESEFLQTYAVGAIGATRLALDVPGTEDKTPFSLSLGVGLRVPMKPRFDIRLETRAFLSFIDSDTAVFCGSGSSGAGCALHGSGSIFAQYALLVGAAFAF